MSGDGNACRILDVVDFVNIGSVIEKTDISRTAIKLDDNLRKSPLDVGVLLYAKRSMSRTPKFRELDGKLCWIGGDVEEDSYQHEREEFLRVFFDTLTCSSNVESTLDSDSRSLFDVFNWCDLNGHSDFMQDSRAFVKAYEAYTDSMYQGVANQRFTPRTASNRQRYMRIIADITWEENTTDWFEEINRISQSGPKEKKVSSDWLTRKYVRGTLSLCRQLTERVLSGGDFPWILDVDGKELQIWPSSSGVYCEGQKIPKIYNVEEYRLCSWEELQRKRKTRDTKTASYPSVCKNAVAEAEGRMSSINSDKRGYYYLLYANLSLALHTMLLRSLTGANKSTLENVLYEDVYDLSRDSLSRQLGDVKLKAGGRVTRYPLGKKGKDFMKSFVSLRQWVLNGKDVKPLFIFLDTGQRPISVSTGQGRMSNATNRAHAFVCKYIVGEKVPNVTSQSRHYKSAILHSMGESQSDISSAMNHTDEVNEVSYTAIPVDIMQGEIASYWASFKATREIIRDWKASDKSVPLGSCDEYDDPIIIASGAPIEPNCNVPEGCMWCEHFLVHADRDDIHKLISCKFVIDELRAYHPDLADIESMFSVLSLRIEDIAREIGEISVTHARMVKDVFRLVFEVGELTPFWARKLSRYELIGVVV